MGRRGAVVAELGKRKTENGTRTNVGIEKENSRGVVTPAVVGVKGFRVGPGLGGLGSGGLLFEGFFGLSDQGLDSGFVGDSEVGEDFAVEIDAGGFEAFDKSAIGHAVSAGRRVDALDPQVAEGALADFAVTIVVEQGFPNGIFGVTEVFGTEAAVSLGFLNGALAALATGGCVSCSGHLVFSMRGLFVRSDV